MRTSSGALRLLALGVALSFFAMPAVSAGENRDADAKRKGTGGVAAMQSTAEQASDSGDKSAQLSWPTAWQRSPGSDKPRYMSAEKAANVKRLLDRFYANFTKIQTLKLHFAQKEYLCVPSSVDGTRHLDEARNYLRIRKDADNGIEDVEFTCDPIYFHVVYTGVDGSKRGWALTSKNKDATGKPEAERWIGSYKDGGFASVTTLVEYGRDIRIDVTMDYDLPGLESYVRKARAAHARYDVVEQTDASLGLENKREYFFSRETGMLDFFVSRLAEKPRSAMKLYAGSAFEYWKVGDIYYPKSQRSSGTYFTVRSDSTWTGLVINGIPADGKPPASAAPAIRKAAGGPATVESSAERASVPNGKDTQPPRSGPLRRAGFSDKPRQMSADKAAKVRLILDRFYANFAKIQTFKCHFAMKEGLSIPPSVTDAKVIARAVNYFNNKERKAANNRIEDVEFTCDPIYFRLVYTGLNGSKSGWALTSKNKDATGRPEAERWIASYKAGEFVLLSHLVEYGADIRTDVTMDYDLPGIESYIRKARAAHARYDVVEEDAPKLGVKKEYFFNRETGMPDFCICHMAEPPGSTSKLESGQAWEYWSVGGIYYPKSEGSSDIYFTVHVDSTWTGLVINGIPADEKLPASAAPARPPSAATPKPE